MLGDFYVCGILVYSDDPRASSVGGDSAAPMEALVGKVIEAGYRRIALLSLSALRGL